MATFDGVEPGLAGASVWAADPQGGSVWNAPPGVEAAPPTVTEPEPLASPHTESEYQAAMGEFGGVATDPQLAGFQQMADMARAMTAYAAGLKDGTVKGPEDLAALMDHEKAKHELADKFEVVPDDYAGPRYHNTLTESDFRKTAGTFSDIRQDRADLKIDTAAYNHDDPEGKRKTMDDIATILQTAEGRTVINRLANNTGGSEVDEQGQPVHHTTTLNITPVLNDPSTEPAKTNDPEVFMHDDGTYGKGANSTVTYAPGYTAIPPGGADAPLWAQQGGRSDLVLFHELVHAVHQTEGSFAGRSEKNVLPADADGQTFRGDEYRTIGLNGQFSTTDGMVTTENAYREARNHISPGGQRAGDDHIARRTQYWPEAPSP